MTFKNASAERAAVLMGVKINPWALEGASERHRNDREIILASVQRYGMTLQYASDDLKSDREVVLAAVRQYGKALEYSSDDLKNDPEVVLAAVHQYGMALQYASDDLKNDREVVLAAVRQYGKALEYASDDLKNDPEVVLAALHQYGMALRYASDDLKNDREVVLAAVRQWGYALEYASDDLKNDREIVLAVVRRNGVALKYASDNPKNDREVVLAAVQQNGEALQDASDDLKNDREVVLAVVQQNGNMLEYASDDLKNDREVVLVAVQQNGNMLEYASDDLKNDREVVLAAVQQNGNMLEYASEDLKNDREVVLAVVQQNGIMLKDASEDLKNDLKVVLAAVRQNGNMLEYASDDLKNDREVVLAAVRQNGNMLEYASEDLKNDREVVLAAVQQNGIMLKDAPEDLKNDREVVLAAVQQDGMALLCASDNLTNDHEVVQAAVQQNGIMLEYASGDLKNDREVVLAAVQQDGSALEYASDDLKNDREVVFAAVQQNCWSLKYASDDPKNDREVVLAAVRQKWQVLQYASDDPKNDREVVLAAVQQYGRALEYASEDLKNDREVVLVAVQQDWQALEYATQDQRNDREVMLIAVRQDGKALKKYASGDLKNDHEVVLAAVRKNGTALRYASEDLKNDREVVLAAVQQNGYVLERASGDLKNDREVVLAAIQQKVKALKHVPTKFMFDDELAEVAVNSLRSEEGYTTLFELIQDGGRAAHLGQFVRADPEITNCLDSKGMKAIGGACKECRKAMEKALRLFGDFDVDAGHLHFSRTACVLSATSHVEGEGGTTRVALKGMRELDQVLAELEGRKGLDPNKVVAVLAVYVDASIGDTDKETIKKAIPVYERENKIGPAVEVRYVEDNVEQLLRPILASRIKSASSSSGESIGRTSDNETESGAGSGYRFMLVLEFGERALSTALMHDRIAGGDLHTPRKIGSDVAQSSNHLHRKGRIHSDLKPLNIVRIGSTWEILDLDVSCAIGSSFGKKTPSSGYCPPEMAKLMLAAIDEDANISEKLSSYTAGVAYDLWSFGVVLFHLVTGRPLWLCDDNDNVGMKDLRILAHATKDDSDWSDHLDDGLFDLERRNSSPEKKAAAHLLRKLLDPDPLARKKHFKGKFPMQAVLEEPFFQGKGVDDATLQDVAQHAEAAERFAKKAADDTTEIIETMTDFHYELRTTRKILLKGMFEATEVMIPTAFIVLEELIPNEKEEKEMELFQLKEDGSGFELEGDAAKLEELVKKQLGLAEKWLGRTREAFEGITDADPKKLFGSLKDTFKDLVTADTLYLYLVDELTGKPVRDQNGIYPIEITTPSEEVPQLLPVMQVGMRAMSLYNGVAGIARMFGAPVPKVPDPWRKGAQESVELLKQKSSVEKFGVVHEEVISADRQEKAKGGIRGDSYCELKKFFEKYSKKDEDGSLYFAGLHRLPADDGTAVWTVLTDEQEIKKALKKREGERLAEEAAHEEYVEHLREQAQHDTSQEADTLDSKTAETDTGQMDIILQIVKGRGFKTVKKNLIKPDVPDVYCKVKYGPSEWQTHYVENVSSPVWSAEKVFKYDPNQDIIIDVFDRNRKGAHDYYGRARSAVSDILNANNGSLDLEVKKQESPHGLTNRWSGGMFITIKCHKRL